MDLCRVFTSCQLVEEFLVLIGNPVPAIYSPDLVWGAPAIAFCQLWFAFNQLDFLRQIVRVAEEQTVFANNFGIEWVFMSQDAVTKAKRLQERRIRASHHVAMNIGI